MPLVIKPFSLPLYGSLAIHGYGIAVACGIGLLFWCIFRATRNRYSPEVISTITTQSLIVGWLGGRLLHVLTESGSYGSWSDIAALWRGGFSVLGGIAALVIFIPWSLKRNNIPLLPALDIAALYGPLAHAIGRLGCLWAGCCFGCISDSPFSIIYATGSRQAPLGVPLVPTQLYSALCFMVLFVVLYALSKHSRALRPGTLVGVYLIGMALERFCIDFIRNDRIMTWGTALSLHQWIALVIMVGTGTWMLYLYRHHLKTIISSRIL